jgi:hypothetical protein
MPVEQLELDWMKIPNVAAVNNKNGDNTLFQPSSLLPSYFIIKIQKVKL